MPRFFSILLLLIVGFQPVEHLFFYLWYHFGNASFTRSFCENIEQPQLQCHGKCQLAELAQLPKDQPAENKALPLGPVPEPRQLDSPPPPCAALALKKTRINTPHTNFSYRIHPGFNWVSSLFHPPRDIQKINNKDVSRLRRETSLSFDISIACGDRNIKLIF